MLTVQGTSLPSRVIQLTPEAEVTEAVSVEAKITRPLVERDVT